MDSKPNFRNNVNYILSQCIKLLGLARRVTFSLSSLHRLDRLYFSLVRSKVEYSTVV
jgi:hypothetical protein